MRRLSLMLVCLLAACSRPEDAYVRALVGDVRLGIPVEKLAAVREGRLEIGACSKLALDAFDDCRQDLAPADTDQTVLYALARDVVAHIEVRSPVGRLVAADLRTELEAVRLRGELPSPGELRVETNESAVWVRTRWEVDERVITWRFGLVDAHALADRLDLDSTGETATVSRTFLSIGRPADAAFLPGDRATLDEAVEALEAFSRRATRQARMRRKLASGTFGPSDCVDYRDFTVVPETFCRGLAEAVESGRTSREGREALTTHLRSRGYQSFTGFIIAQVADGVYEVSPARWYWGTALPSESRKLLRTVATTYSSKGRFTLWVKTLGTERITTKDGFEQDWEVLEEDVLGTAVKNVFAAPAGESTSKAAAQVLSAML